MILVEIQGRPLTSKSQPSTPRNNRPKSNLRPKTAGMKLSFFLYSPPSINTGAVNACYNIFILKQTYLVHVEIWIMKFDEISVLILFTSHMQCYSKLTARDAQGLVLANKRWVLKIFRYVRKLF